VSRARPQADWCREWRARSAALVTRAQALRAVSTAALTRPRADGGWSAAQVLEHLVLTSESYLARMRQRVEAARGTDRGERFAWRGRLGGRLLVRALEAPRALPAPRGFRPGPTPRPHVAEAFIEEIRELVALLDRAETLRWSGIRFGSPLFTLLRLDFGDGCLILVTHAERHFGQIDRVLAEPEPPVPA
jgi:hypothetical protein